VSSPTANAALVINAPPQPNIRALVLDIALNTIIPIALYKLSKRYISPSEFTALLLATTFPMGKSIFDFARHRQLDPVSIIVLLGIGTSGVAVFMGGSPKILLIRESLFTCVFGLACFASLLLPRPMMFYFGQHMFAGANVERRRKYGMSWALPEVRFGNRLTTIVWGTVYLAEFAIRVVIVYTLPVATVLVVSPILLGGLTVATLIWTLRYVRKMRERAIPKIQEMARIDALKMAAQ